MLRYNKPVLDINALPDDVAGLKRLVLEHHADSIVPANNTWRRGDLVHGAREEAFF